jgi:hypothetical protein
MLFSRFGLGPNEEGAAIAGFDVEPEWLLQTFDKFSKSPVFGGVGKSLKTGEPHYLKPPSARSTF